MPTLADQTLRFIILGIASGSLVAMVALGIVLAYRASGVLNFSAGAFGAIGAFLFYVLRDDHGWPTAAALIVSLLLGVGLGALTHYAIRFMGSASILAKVIATLGLMAAGQGAIIVFIGDDRGTPASLLPTRVLHLTRSIPIGMDQLIIIGLVICLSVALWFVYGKTLFGLATSAVSENRRVAAASGWSPATVELVNFTVAGLLSTIAGILIAPIVTLNSTALTLLVIPALAAALLGRFSSFPLTVLGAMAIGVAQNLLSLYENDISTAVHVSAESLASLPDVVPLLIILVVLVVRGSTRLARSETQLRLPLPGDGRVNWPLLLTGAAVGLVLIFSLSPTWNDAITLSLVGGMLILSIVVVTGYGGQLSLAQFALAGMGCWIAARLVANAHIPFAWAVIIGVVGTIPVGLLVAVPALRSRGVNLAVATLALASMIESMIFSNGSLTGGYFGTVVKPPELFGFSIDPIAHPQRYAVFALVMLVIVGLAVANVRRGHTGRRLMAVRSNERAAAAVGVGVLRTKLYAFALAAAIAALAGILYGFRQSNVQFTVFDVTGSISAVLNAIIGGIGWASGSIVGAQLQPQAMGAQLWRTIAPNVSQLNAWLMILSGVAAVVTLRTAPDGIAALHSHQLARLRSRIRPPRPHKLPVLPLAALPGARPPRQPAQLAVTGISVSFGGVSALSDVSFSVAPGEVVGLMGPNGAGKTTMLDVITGFTRPQSGQVRLNGEPVSGHTPEQLARQGIGRSWQSVELFEAMSVQDNLLVAADSQAPLRYLTDIVAPARPSISEDLSQLIQEFGLEPVLSVRPSALPQGTARLAGIARAVAAQPAVLLLDEPAAGLDVVQNAELAAAIRRVVDNRGIGVLLVEHDVEMLASICDRIVVLDFGRLIADGTPAEVLASAEVGRAYLGEETAPGADQEPAIPDWVL